jgi:hypothetical protein
MAQMYRSPSVTANEVDQTFSEQAPAQVGAVVVGRTPKGPAFIPVQVPSYDEFVARFGSVDPDYHVPYAAKSYLQNAGNLTVVRVLGHDDGTTASSAYQVGCVAGIIDAGAYNVTGSVLAVVHHSGARTNLTVTGVALNSTKFIFNLGGGAFAVTASFVSSSDDYVAKVLNTDPTKYSTYGHYLADIYKYQAAATSASWNVVALPSASHNSFIRDFENGQTTWIKSQPVGGTEYSIFKFHTIGSGRATNDEVKVTVANVKPAAAPTVDPYGTFDIVVRDFYDDDRRPVVLETFSNCNLNPNDLNYVARRIGDMKETFDTAKRKFIVDGSFPNRSRYVRIEMNTAGIYPAAAIPFGFGGYPKAVFSQSYSEPATIGANNVPSLPYTGLQKDGNGTYNPNICWGVLFVSGGIADRMHAFPDGLAAGLSDTRYVKSDSDFSLKNLTSSYDNGSLRYSYDSSWGRYTAIYASASLHKFTVPFYGGFDGWDLRTADPLYLTNSAAETDIGVVSAKRAIDTVANPDSVEMNLIAVPGVHNLKVCDHARYVANERKDVLFIMDISGSSVNEVRDNLKSREIDDNYCAVYYPDVKLDDKENNQIVRVAPSVAILGAIAYSDRVKQPFFAPAGLERGGLKKFDVIDVCDRLTYDERNTLYDERINPIAFFPGEGVSVFGQKNLQLRSSALDRVNVRRLMIMAKGLVTKVAKKLLFEPNDAMTWQRFTNAVNPIFEKIQIDRGIYRFKVIMDSTTTTQDVIERNGMVGKIFLQPTRTAEYITLDFIISNAGIAFGE